MLITFKSAASADITMYQAHVKVLLDALDKYLERGVWSVMEMNHVIDVIQQLVEQERREHQQQIAQEDESELDDIELKKKNDYVSLSARFYPLVEMIKAAQKKQKEIVWGV